MSNDNKRGVVLAKIETTAGVDPVPGIVVGGFAEGPTPDNTPLPPSTLMNTVVACSRRYRRAVRWHRRSA